MKRLRLSHARGSGGEDGFDRTPLGDRVGVAQVDQPVGVARLEEKIAQEVGAALGAQAGEAKLAEVITSGGGFGQVRRATETPFNMILEARP